MPCDRSHRVAAGVVVLMGVFATRTDAYAQSSGGPDGYGYTWSTAGWTFEDIRSSSRLFLGDDQMSGGVGIGFNFVYYGNTYNTAYVSSNGFISFLAGQSNGCCSGVFFPNTGSPNATIAGYWEDLYPPRGIVTYGTRGSAPNRRFLVQWTAVPHYCCSGNQVTMQIVLYETSNDFEIRCSSCPSDGGRHVTGFDDALGTRGLSIRYGSYSLFSTRFYVSSPQVATGCGGPDSFGYAWCRQGWTFEDIRNYNNIPLGDDQMSGAIPIGFTFSWYGTLYSSLYVSSNGFISFEPGQYNGCCQGTQAPNGSNPNSVISAYWEDLYPPGGGSIRYVTFGGAPNRRFLVQWTDIPHYPNRYPSGNPVTMQIVLYEGSNNFEIRCATCSPYDSGPHSTGFESPAGNIGLNIAYGTYTLNAARFLGTAPVSPTPSLNAGGPYSVNEGSAVTVSGSCSPSCTTAGNRTYGWDFNGDNVYDANGTSVGYSGGVDGASTRTIRFGTCWNGSCNWSNATVNVANVTPTFTSNPPTTGNVSQAYSYAATASDPAGGNDPFSWSLLAAPPGMSVNASSGLVQWTPTTSGTFTVTLRVNDGDGGVRDQTWNVDVGEAGGPDFAGYQWTRAFPWTWDDISGTGTAVTLGDDQVTGEIPIGFTYNFYGRAYARFVISSNGYLMLAPGTYADGCCSGVQSPNTGGANALIATYWEDIDPRLGGSIRYQVLGSAPNRYLVVQYTNIQHFPAGTPTTFQIVLFEGQGHAELRCLNCASDGGLHAMGFENARGDIGLSVRYGNFSLTNARFRMVAPPVHTDIGGPYAVDEGSSITLVPSCYNCTSYTWDLDNNGTFETPGTNPTFTGLDGAGTQAIQVRACNGGTCGMDRWVVQVNNVAPRFTNSPAATGTVNVGYAYDATASDPAGGRDTITWQLVTAPAGMTMSNGQVRWTPTAPGAYTVTLRVRDEDGGATDLTWTIDVGVSVNPGGPYTVAEGSAVTLTASCTGCATFVWDLDNDNNFETAGASVSYTGLDGASSPVVRVRGCSGARCSTAQPQITVTNQNPTITTNPTVRTDIGVPWRYAASASDPAGARDTLTWSLTTAPAGMSVVAGTGVVTWTPATAGSYSVVLRVAEEDGGFATQAFTLVVNVTADAGGPYAVNEGGSVSLTGNCNGCTRYEWDLDNNGTYEATGRTVTYSAASLDGPSTPTARMRACEDATANNCATAVPNITVQNVAPAITTTPPGAGTLGTAYRYAPSATDPAGARDTLVWSLVSGPSGLTVASATGVVDWATPAAGRSNVTIEVNDGDGGATRQSWTIVVVSASAGGPYTADEGGTINLVGSCTACTRYEWDLDGDGTYENTTQNPTYAALDGAATPTIRMRACDGAGTANCVTVTPSVTVRNVAPTITSTPPVTGDIGVAYRYAAAATDPAGTRDPLTWSLVSAPAGMAVDAAGVVTWTPATGGTRTVTLRVSDGDGGTRDQTWTLVIRLSASAGGPYTVAEGGTVNLAGTCNGCTRYEWDLDNDGAYEVQTQNASLPALDGPATPTVRLRACEDATTNNCATSVPTITLTNVAPTITTTPGTIGQLGRSYSYQAAATDPGGARDPLAWTVIAGPTGLAIGAGSGLVQWASATAGRHTVTIEVGDGDGGTQRQTWTLVVVDASAGGPYALNEGATVTLQGTCTGCTRFEWDLDDNGTYETQVQSPSYTAGDGPASPTIRLRACGGAGTANCAVSTPMVTIANVAPSITSAAPGSARLGQAFSYTAVATDPAGAADPLTWTRVSGPTGLAIAAQTGVVSWATPVAGRHAVTIEVADGDGGATRQSFTLVVVQATPGGPYAADEGQTIALGGACTACTSYAWDLDNNGTFETAGQNASYLAADGNATPTVTLRACDGAGTTNCHTSSPSITVRNVSPAITSTPPGIVVVGTAYRYTPAATDPAGARDTLTWSLSGAPAGMTVNPMTGVVDWAAPTAGTQNVTLRVADEDGGASTQTWALVVVSVSAGGPYAVDEGSSITVASTCTGCTRFDWDLDNDGTFETTGQSVAYNLGIDGTVARTIVARACNGAGTTFCARQNATVNVANVAPVIVTSPPGEAIRGLPYSYSAQATDPAGARDTLTWSLITPPAGMTVNASTGQVAWTPNIAGTYRITLRVQDEDGGSATQSWDLVVPVGVTTGGPYSVDEGGMINMNARCAACVRFDWDLDNDGTFEVPGQSAMFRGGDGPLTRTIRVRACQNADGTGCDVTDGTVTVRNVPPTVTSTPSRAGTIGAAYSYTPRATDPAGALDPLTWSLVAPPMGMTMNASGVVSFTPAAGGTYPVRIRVDDGDMGVREQAWNLVVQITAAAGGPYAVDEGSDVTLTASCNGCGTNFTWDLNGDGVFETTGRAVIYRGVDGPATPLVRVRACDPVTPTNCATADASVTVANVAPSITSMPGTRATIGQQYVYTAAAVDAGGAGDTITWSLVSPPAGMTVDAATGRVSFTPTAGGRAVITLRASDGEGGVTEQRWILITNVTVEVGGPYAVDEGGAVDLTAQCNGCSRYAWDRDGDGTFETDGQTISFTGADGPASPTVRFQGCEGLGTDNCATDTAAVDVRNVRPTITSTPARAGTPGVAYRYAPVATDPGGANDPLAWALVSGPMGMTINAGTGVIDWAGPAAGRYNVTIEVSDGDGGFRRQAWTISVISVSAGGPYAVDEGASFTLSAACTACTRFEWDLDDNGTWDASTQDASFTGADGASTRTVRVRACDGAGTANCATAAGSVTVRNVAPAITTAPVTTAQIGVAYRYAPAASDPAGALDPIRWSLTRAPAGMTIDATTGVIAWTPAAGGTVGVTVRADDGDMGTFDQAYNLVVQVGASAGGPYTMDEGAGITLAATCSGCTRYEWDLDDDGRFDTTGQTTAFPGTFPAVDGPATRRVVVRACEGAGTTNCNTGAAAITVRNIAPTITSTPARSGQLGAAYTYSPVATDPAGANDRLTWSVRTGPAGMTIDAATGALGWPSPIAGRHPVTIAVDDGDMGTRAQAWTVVVVGASAGGPYTADEGTTVNLAATCTACTTFDWDTNNDGTFETAGASATFSALDGPGSAVVRVRACDGAGQTNCAIATGDITILNVRPTITSTPARTGAINTAYTYQPVATDPAGTRDALRWSLVRAPMGMTIDASTGLVSWTPPSGGTRGITIRVEDGDGGARDQAWDLAVRVAATAGGPYVVDEGNTIALSATCDGCTRFEWDLDGDGTFETSGGNPNYSGVDGPATPAVRVRACEGAGTTNCAVVAPSVTVRNVAPVIGTQPARGVGVGQRYTYAPSASDPGGARDPLVWSLVSGPTGMTVSSTSGFVRWTAAAGMHPVTLEVADGDGGTARQMWTIAVVSGSIGGPYAVDEGSQVELGATCQSCTSYAWDLDNNGTYDDAVGATTIFSAARLDGALRRTIGVRVCDATQSCATDTTFVDVRNVAPMISTTPVRFGDAGRPYRYAARADDPAGADDPLTWSLIAGPPGMAIGAQSGVLTWVAVAGRVNVVIRADDGDGGVATQSWTIDVVGAEAGGPYTVGEGSSLPLRATCVGCTRYEWDLDGDGTYEVLSQNTTFDASAIDGRAERFVRLRACDMNGLCGTDTATVTVENVAPTITSTPVMRAENRMAYSYQATATDPAGARDPFTWSLVSGPPGMAIDAMSGLLTWTASPGDQRVIIEVSDGDGGLTRQTWDLIVPAPVTIAVGGPYMVEEGGVVTVEATCNPMCEQLGWDFDGDGVYTDAAGERATFDAAMLDGPGTFVIRARGCLDGFCTTGSGSTEVMNVAPTITSTPARTGISGDRYGYLALADDPAGTRDPFTWTLITAPMGMTIGANSGILAWNATPGRHPVLLEVADGDGGTRRQAWTIAVAPVIVSATFTPRPQPQRVDFELEADAVVDWRIDLYKRRDGACSPDLLARRTVQGVLRTTGTIAALSTGASYCFTVTADRDGELTTRSGTFDTPAMSTFVTGPRADPIRLDVLVTATVSAPAAGEVRLEPGDCASMPTALRFDRAQIATIPGSVIPAAAFTVEAWLFVTSGAAASGAVFSAGAGAMRLELVNGALVFTVDRNSATAAVATPQDRWVHVAAMFESDTRMRLFLDGVPRADIIPSGGPLSASFPGLVFGGAQNAGFSGAIAAAAVYARALTFTEVTAHASAAPADELRAEADRVAAWTFSEAPGVQSIYDASGNHWAGTLGADHTVEPTDPARLPAFGTVVAMGTGTALRANLTRLTGGPTYCYWAIATNTLGRVTSRLGSFTRQVDSMPPALVANALTVEECTGMESASLTLPLPATSDDYDADPLVEATVGGRVIGFPYRFPLGTTVVRWRSTDDSGNVATADQTVRIRDTRIPAITGGAEVRLEATSPAGTTYTPMPESASDVCSGVTVASDAPAAFPLGVTTVTFTADDSSQNRARATRSVRIVDTTAPSFDPALADLTVGHDNTACFAFTPPSPGVRDNGYRADQIAVTYRRVTGPGAGNCWGLGTHVVEWTITDPSGNTRTGIQTIVVAQSTLLVAGRGLEVGGRPAQPGVFYNQSVTVVFDVSGGTQNYQLTLVPPPAALTNAGTRYSARYDAAGAYPQVIVTVRDGSSLGSAVLPGFGIDLTAPVIDADLIAQGGVNPLVPASFPRIFFGESLSLEKVLARDGAVETTSLVRAARFDGGDVITVPSSTSLSLTGALSLEAWVRVEGRRDAAIIAKAPTGAAPYGYMLGTTAAGAARFELRVDGASRTITGGALTPRAWHHLAATYDGRAMRLWVDGEPASYRLTTGAVDPGAGTTVSIGAAVRGEMLAEPFEGELAQAGVWRRALSESEVRTRWRGGVGRAIPARSTGAVLTLAFEAAGQSVPDLSGAGNPGTMGLTAAAGADEPAIGELAHPSDPASSGIASVTISLVTADGTRRSPLSEVMVPAAGTPLRVGPRAAGGLDCTAPLGSVCNLGETVIRAELVSVWDMNREGSYYVEVRAADAAGNTSVRRIAFRTQSYVSALGEAITGVTALLNDPANAGGVNALNEARSSLEVARSYATMRYPYPDGSYLRADQGLDALYDAAVAAVDIGALPETIGRALAGDVTRYLGSLPAQAVEDARMKDDAGTFLLDARFERVARRYGQSSALARDGMDAVALLYPGFAPMRDRLRQAQQRWQQTLDLHGQGLLDVISLQRDTVRVTAIGQLMGATRDVLSEVLYREVSAALENRLTTERNALEQIRDVIDRDADTPDEAGDLVRVTNQMAMEACVDQLVNLTLTDEAFTRCYLRLNDLARVLDRVSEPLVHTYRWRAGLALVLFNMLELSMNVSPTGLPWVTSNAVYPELQLVLPDARAARVPTAVPVSRVDAPDGALARAYERYDTAARLLREGEVNRAWAIFVDERCILLRTYNRYYSTDRAVANAADPKDTPIAPATVGCAP